MEDFLINNKILEQKYNEFSLEEKKLIHTIYHSNENKHNELTQRLEKVIFRLTPPTPKQFLDPKEGWLTPQFIESIYSHVREDFLEILDFKKKYNQIVEYGATRLGKSYLARLLIMYTIVFIHCLRQPQLYYGLSPTTQLCIYMICFKSEKIKQLLLKPIYELLRVSPRFKKVKFEDKVQEEQDKIGLETIVWSKSATFGEMTLDSGLTINLGIDFMSFIGSDMIQLIVSEIAFFIQQAGATHEQIFQLYTDGLDRIKATVGNNYLGMVYLDTSANDVENSIEKYILEDLQFQDKVFFKRRNRWEARPYLFPKWQKTNKTFDVFIGTKSDSAKIIENEIDFNHYSSDKIIQVPIDVKDEFKRNLNKSLKDIAGLPTYKENKLITSFTIISDMFNNTTLKNIDSILYAESSDIQEKLLWKQIKDKFFNYTNGKYYFYRAPKEPRFVGLDLSYSLSGDVQGISFIHKEWSRLKNEVMYITDFAFAIGAKKSKISLSAPFQLIMDIYTIAGIPVYGVYVDSFQSESDLQFLQRNNIVAGQQSVDRTLSPYQFYLSLLENRLKKAGKNIFLKNNLDSLITVNIKKRENTTNEDVREKVDHTKGKTENMYNGNWNRSSCGINAKDVSDADCQAVWGAKNHETYKLPSTCYEDENDRLLNTKKYAESLLSKAYDKIHICY